MDEYRVAELLLAGGAASFIWTIVHSILAFRDRAEAREDKATARLADYEAECREQLAREREWGAHWFRVAGILRFHLGAAGIPDPPLPPEPDRDLSGPIGPPPALPCEDC